MSIGLFLVLLSGCAVSWFPLPRRINVVETAAQSADLGRGLRIEWPQRLRPGEVGWLVLTVLAAQGGNSVTAAVTTRLDLPGLAAEGQDSGQVVSPEGEVQFRWKLHSEQTGLYSGRLWVYAGKDRELLIARPVQIEVGGPQMAHVWMLRIILLSAVLFASVFWVLRKQLPFWVGCFRYCDKITLLQFHRITVAIL